MTSLAMIFSLYERGACTKNFQQIFRLQLATYQHILLQISVFFICQ